jgi:TPP-dependent pyruvate/acetoin dehydrogenase alpha subunit
MSKNSQTSLSGQDGSDETLTSNGRELLYRMIRIRYVEETIAERYSDQEMRCPTHLCTGQEAVSAASGLVLRDDDFAVSGHRAHGHYLGKGGDLTRMLAEIHGKVTGCSRGKGGSMHLIDTSVGFAGSSAIVGGTIPIGVGLALSATLHGTDQVSCVFFGEAATEEGVFYESVHFAVLKKLPVLFLCENNLYSVYSPMTVRQASERQNRVMLQGMGLQYFSVDGNDACAVVETLKQVVDSARAGHGPAFCEFATYRWREHCGPNYDLDLPYRPQEEVDSWKTKDPLAQLQSRLLETGILKNNDIQEMKKAIEHEVDAAFRVAREAPFPEPEDALSDVYAD